MSGHLTDDQLVDQLYGLAGDDTHLESCDDCARRWRGIRERRAILAAAETVSPEFLAAQRRLIYSRLGEPRRHRTRWAPALAAAGLVVIGVLMYRPSAPARPDAGDAQLFSDAYSMGESTEPEAGAPIHALFEDNQ